MIEDVEASAFGGLELAEARSAIFWPTNTRMRRMAIQQVSARQPVWSGTGEAPLIGVRQAERGLLTRAAMLSTGTATTRPIHKGYVIRNAMLCQQCGRSVRRRPTPTPPRRAPTAKLTTREAVVQLTSGGACGGCHLTRINPPGLHHRGLRRSRPRAHRRGAFRSTRRKRYRRSPPVDTKAVPAVVPSDARRDDERGAADGGQIDESKLFTRALARHYFRFTQRRVEATWTRTVSSIGDRASGPEWSTYVRGAEARRRLASPSFKTRRFQ